MTRPTVSVIVVSRRRPQALKRCLTGIAQLDYRLFDVIVVADAAGCSVVPDGMRAVPFETPNISEARNLGLSHAGGDIVAFIDDDAIPEPTWLTHLCEPFQNPQIAASGGFVIGRNGISFQWKARMAFPDGSAVDMKVDREHPTVLQGEPGRAIKTEGTNMAFRAKTLRDIGGFDPVFAFYLDETDVNMRLAAIGAKTAIVPLAQVHHGFAESDRRTAKRVPRDLSAIGTSLRAFVAKHDRKADFARIGRAERRGQELRLLRHMRDGRIMPGDVRKVLRTFDNGWGRPKTESNKDSIDNHTNAFQPFDTGTDDEPTLVLSGRFWQKRQLFDQAREAVTTGRRVCVILLSLTTRFHVVRFHADGFWVQEGGQFGKSDRSDPIFRLWQAKKRVRREVARVSRVRKMFT